MSPLWRGFAGLVAVFLLAYFVSDLEKKIEDEKALIHRDPEAAARQAFEDEQFAFYESWVHRFDEDGNQIGYWFLPGEKKIPATILEEYPERIKLENSDGLLITLEHERNNRRSRIWALKYNIHLAELLTGDEPAHSEKKD